MVQPQTLQHPEAFWKTPFCLAFKTLCDAAFDTPPPPHPPAPVHPVLLEGSQCRLLILLSRPSLVPFPPTGTHFPVPSVCGVPLSDFPVRFCLGVLPAAFSSNSISWGGKEVAGESHM